MVGIGHATGRPAPSSSLGDLGATTVPTGVYAATSDFGPGADGLTRRIGRAARELAELTTGTRAPRPTLEPELVPFADLLAASSGKEP